MTPASSPVCLVLLTALAGCAGGTAVDATSLLSYDQCRGIDSGLTRVDYADVASIRGSTLLNLQSSAAGPAAGDLLLIAISRGRHPTPGYRMTLDGASRRDDTTVIEVTWTTPESGAVLAQMMTHPCLVVGLSRAGVSKVEAVDQAGNSLGSLTL
jgi:hypothetical protein